MSKELSEEQLDNYIREYISNKTILFKEDNLKKPPVRRFFRAQYKYQQLVSTNDPSVRDLEPSTYLVVDPALGVVFSSMVEKEAQKHRRVPQNFIFRHQHEYLAKSVT